MSQKLLPAGNFAKIARTTSATLHHYDKIGLLSPFLRGENNYRYYSLVQLSQINLIHTLQELGLSLDEIKILKDQRTPERTANLLKYHLEKIGEKINDWVNIHTLLLTLLNSILSVQDVDENAITIQFLPAKPIILGDWNEYDKDEDGYDTLVKFYDSIMKKHDKININYPVWALFTEENLKLKMDGHHTWPERYYFYTSDGNDKRPAGLYAIGYARGGYGQKGDLYIRLRDYIDKSGFEVSGNAYEEYPLNEICIADDTNYLMRVMISVRSRETPSPAK